jgi:tRNA uridine 5-carboxymethylaminomethyl modification enzyme
MGLDIRRFKTGTPPRLNKRTINFDLLESQLGDESICFFSHWNDELFHVEHSCDRQESRFPPGSLLRRLDGQVCCHITQTTERTAAIIRDNLDRSPLFSGIIEGTGPRYCPSIEDKVVRFTDRFSHQLFLEPEGIETDEIYVNGLSTSLPYEVQIDLVRSILGCEEAEILRPAYAVEYDYCDPLQLDHSLKVRCSSNLFLAGQINGTSGYEEAAAQGIVAGINATRMIRDLTPVKFKRDQSYIGVLIDDLVTIGTNEPYRMFTSRAENRLFLRQDNADLRLAAIGHEIGLLSKQRAERIERKRKAIEKELHRLTNSRLAGNSLIQILRRTGIRHSDLPQPENALAHEIAEQVEIMAKYAGYLERQSAENQRWKKLESMVIPEAFDFSAVGGLRIEARQKLAAVRPTTLRQAARISGVTPADISLLAVMVRRS